MTTHLFHIQGMHCPSCEKLTEMTLGDAPGVKHVKASLSGGTVEVTGEFGDTQPDDLACVLSPLLQPHGYTLSLEARRHDPRWSEFLVAVPAAVAMLALFFILQKGVEQLSPGLRTGYGLAFVIGLVASVSSCMAIVGGLALSLSAYYARDSDKLRPLALFHIGRLVSFFILGGVTGAAGSVLHPDRTGNLILGLLVGTAMVLLGIGLLDVFPGIGRLQPRLPEFFRGRIHDLNGLRTRVMPFILGVATFFLPCAFTQSMQIYALNTGSFFAGAMTMLVFALGTLPALVLLSFSSFRSRGRKASGLFFKTVGIVIVLFGLYNVLISLVAYGVISPVFTF